MASGGGDSLREYRRRRSFETTPEPRADRSTPPGRGDRFVVQEHHARRLHWDLRLERDGVLASWALPRGFPDRPEQNRLAVHTEDHPLSYIDFEGEIPSGNYGAGRMTIWDSGTYEAEKWEPEKLVVRFSGEKLSGRYSLFRTRGRDWMIHRMDPPAEGSEPLPERIEPMRATASELPADDSNWGYEVMWDGVRAVALCEPGHVRLQSASMEELADRFPEIRAIALELAGRPVALDGVLVAFDEDGRPSRERLRRRAAAGSESTVRRRMVEVPATYVIFDLLHLDGRSLVELAYEERRAELESLELDGTSWQTPAHHRGEGEAVLEAGRAQGVAGIVAKRLESAYLPGERSTEWLAIEA